MAARKGQRAPHTHLRPRDWDESNTPLKTRPEWPVWLRLQRKKLGLTQRELSLLVGGELKHAYYLESRVYLQKHRPSPVSCRALARVFGADPQLVLYLAGHIETDPRQKCAPQEVRDAHP